MQLNNFIDALNLFPISNDSKELLIELRNRKVRLNNFTILITVPIFIELIILYKFKFSFYLLFQNLLSSPFIFYVFIPSTALLIYCFIEISKASKKLELIRKETIEKLEKSSTDWIKSEKSQLRDELSTFIKTSLDINIRYKT
jgi:hypothetical protein